MVRPLSRKLRVGCVNASAEKLFALNRSARRPHPKTAKPLACSNAVRCTNVKRVRLPFQQMIPQLMQFLHPQGVALSLQCRQIPQRPHDDQCGLRPNHWTMCQRAVMKEGWSTLTVKASPRGTPVFCASATMEKLIVLPKNARHRHQTIAEE